MRSSCVGKDLDAMWNILDLLLKNLRLNPLAGDKVLTVLLSQLHKGMVMVGSGSKILGWIALVTEGSFQLIQYVSYLFLILSKVSSDTFDIKHHSFEQSPQCLLTAPLVESDKEADERHYLLWRIENGVAEGSTEIPKGRIISQLAY